MATDELIIGKGPGKLTVQLTSGADIRTTIQRKDGEDWDVDTVLYLEFEFAGGSKQRFDATIDGPDALFAIESPDVQTVIDAKPRIARVWYELGTLRLLWAKGTKFVIE